MHIKSVMGEIDDMKLIASDEEETVLEPEDHISGASELSSEDDKPENHLSDSIYMSTDKSFQYRSEPPLQKDKRTSKNILNLAPGPTKYVT